jgi:hypothetical protein
MEFGSIESFDYYYLEIIPGSLLAGLIFLPTLYVFCYLPLRLALQGIARLFERFTWESAAVFEASEFALSEICKNSGAENAF